MHSDDIPGSAGEGATRRPELRVVPLHNRSPVDLGGAALHLVPDVSGRLDGTDSEGERADAAQTDRSGRVAEPRNATGPQDVTEETGVKPPGGKGRIDTNGGKDVGTGKGGSKGSGKKPDTTQGGTENRQRTRNNAGNVRRAGAPLLLLTRLDSI